VRHTQLLRFLFAAAQQRREEGREVGGGGRKGDVSHESDVRGFHGEGRREGADAAAEACLEERAVGWQVVRVAAQRRRDPRRQFAHAKLHTAPPARPPAARAKEAGQNESRMHHQRISARRAYMCDVPTSARDVCGCDYAHESVFANREPGDGRVWALRRTDPEGRAKHGHVVRDEQEAAHLLRRGRVLVGLTQVALLGIAAQGYAPK